MQISIVAMPPAVLIFNVVIRIPDRLNVVGASITSILSKDPLGPILVIGIM